MNNSEKSFEEKSDKLSQKKVWEDPELLLLSTEKTEFLAPDIVDGGGPYS